MTVGEASPQILDEVWPAPYDDERAAYEDAGFLDALTVEFTQATPAALEFPSEFNAAHRFQNAKGASQALAVLDAWHTGNALLETLALTLQIAPAGLMGDHERSERVTEEAFERASRIGHQNSISSVILTAANTRLFGDAGDVAASFDLLDRHPVEAVGHLSALWLDITWGVALVDRDLPRAVRHLVSAVRTADRLGTPAPLDQALQVLSIAMVNSGRSDLAEALVAYTDANHRARRIDNATTVWSRERLEAALPDASAAVPPPRRELMTIVDEIERQFSEVDPVGATR